MSVEWLPARLDLLQAEKEHSRRGDELARRQQALPWVRIDKTYRFDTEAMTSTAGAERCAATDGIKAVSFGAPFAPFSPFVNPPLVVASRNSGHRAPMARLLAFLCVLVLSPSPAARRLPEAVCADRLLQRYSPTERGPLLWSPETLSPG